MSKILKDIKASYKRKDVLLPRIERHVLRKAQEPDDRRQDILHPSEMAKGSWCPRHDYYRIKGVPQNFKGRAESFRMHNVYHYGHTAHSKYQTWLWEMGVLWGRWRCISCGETWLGTSPEECPVCGGEQLRYLEVPLEHGIIAGHSDGGLILPDKNRLLEIKTVGMASLRFDAPRLAEEVEEKQLTPDEVWWRISRPFASHQRQGQLYLHLVQLIFPELEIDEIVFLYEWKVTQESKEFVIKYNPAVIQDILDKVEDVSAALDSNQPPSRPEGFKQEGKKCRECGYRKTCWGDEADQAPESAPVRVRRSGPSARRRALRP